MRNDQTARLTWNPGKVPVSVRFDDPYYSLESGLEEARHVFLAGNGLPGRLADGFRVAELGFGTGLNLLALALAWDGPGELHFTSFEAYPMAAADMAAALAAFPEVAAPAAELLAAWQRRRRSFRVGGVQVEVIVGDARAGLQGWQGRADAWFLDGFSPAKNPQMWAPGLMHEVARHTAPGGSFATYTAAGHVRRALEAAGFAVERRPGYGRKRHMATGRLAEAER